MFKTGAEAVAYCEAFTPLIGTPAAEVALCPPFTALADTVRALEGSPVWVASQTVHDQVQGAHTGEVSAPMVLATGARGAIVGHSERRAAGESDAMVAARVRAALDHGLVVILCCGESLEQREAGQTESWLTGQIRAALGVVTREEQDRLVVAYEPIWAIGTGRTASPGQAQDACAHVRAVAAEFVDPEPLRVLYGGSVTPDNAAELFAQADVDGGLVGGASLDPAKFATVVAAAG
jgi:triosephosphate isomerase